LLDGNSFSAYGMKTLAKMADHNSSLLHMSLWRNPVAVQNAQELAMVVARNGIMQSLSIEFTYPATSARFDEILKLGSMLKDNPALSEIGLKGDLGEDGARAVAESILENNSVLLSLSLIDCYIGNQGIRFICDVLASCPNLEYLNLSGNSLDATGAAVIAEALSTNKSIKILDISGNSIGYDGLNSISMAVRKNRSLNRIIIDSSYADQTDLAVSAGNVLKDYLPV
jgi:Ran GTPase-activating protein (RanGAP) involved in mRNA processing and transport